MKGQPYGTLEDEGISPADFLAHCERSKGRSSRRRALRLARLAEREGCGGLVVEVGCGGGFLARPLAERLPSGATIVALDPDPVLIEYARRQAAAGSGPSMSRIHWLRGRVEGLPLASGRATLVVCEDGIHHWSDLAAGMSEIRRALAPGGLVFLSDLHPTCFSTWLALLYVRVKAALGLGRSIESAFARSVARAHPPDDLIEAVRRAGLDPIRVSRRPMSVEILASPRNPA